MNWVFWLAGLLLLGVAAYSVYWAFRSPKFIGKLTSYASKQVWKAVKPEITRPETPEDRDTRVADERRADGDGYFRRKSGAPPKG